MTIRCYIDGSAKPNPGKGGIGIVIRGDGWDYTISEKCEDRVSNNQAEYQALVRCLDELVKNMIGQEEIIIYSDSKLLVEQMSKRRQIDKGGAYVPDHMKALQLKRRFFNLKFQHIPREENAEANLLASRGTRK